MHEAGVTERILEVVSERATEARALRVTDVHLEVGEESGIDTTSIELHWPLLSKGSVADGARLHFDEAASPFTFRLTSIEVDEAGETD